MVSVYVTVTECHFHSHHKGTNAKKKKGSLQNRIEYRNVKTIHTIT